MISIIKKIKMFAISKLKIIAPFLRYCHNGELLKNTIELQNTITNNSIIDVSSIRFVWTEIYFSFLE